MTEIRRFQGAELVAFASDDDGRVTVTLKGSADTRVMAQVSDLLAQVHERALAQALREVIVDFRELEFMNSSCFKAFVTWIVRVQGLAQDAQYRIRFLSDRGKHWQRRSLGALSCFAVDLVQIDA
jgi:hypothetical protein